MRRELFRVLPLCAALICLGTALLAVGCGSGNAHFRFVVGSIGGTTNVDVVVDGNTVLTNIGFGAAGAYQGSSSGSRQFEIFQTGTTTNPYYNAGVTLSSGFNTVVSGGGFGPVGGAGAMTVYHFPDTNAAPTSGNVNLRFIHASPTAGNVDIYIVQPPGSGIQNISPQFSNLAVGTTTATGGHYFSTSAGQYEVIMTQAGTHNTIFGLDSTYNFTTGQVRTIVILDHSTGGAPYSQLLLSDLN